MVKAGSIILVLVAAIVSAPAHAAAERFALQSNLDHVWTTMVFGAVGFMLMFGTSVGGLERARKVS
jgi:hypothetical protein